MSSTWASATSSRAGALLGAALLALALPGAAAGKVFASRSEALAQAFPEADRIESETFALDDEQAKKVEALSGSPLESKLVRIYTGHRGDQVLGYAVIDVHNVRTLPEAFLVVLDPAGSVRALRVLAFHEPLDYLPTERWYGQFEAKTSASPLRLGGDIHGVVGATLSARATTRGVRRVLALYEVLIQPGREG